jgi:hypothetical protein
MATKTLEMPRRKQSRREIAQELALIRHLLKTLEQRIGKEFELGESIVRLEVLMGNLTACSGGML